MSVRQVMASALALLVLVPGLAWSGTSVYGIPSDCRVETWLLAVPGVGDAAAPASERVSAVDMQGRWALHAYRLAPGEQANAILDVDALELHWAGRRARLPIPADRRRNGHGLEWASDGRRAALLEQHEGPPLVQGPARVRCFDVRRLERAEPAPVLYDPGSSGEGAIRTLGGVAWSPAGDALLALERRFPSEADVVESAIVRVEVAPGSLDPRGPPRDVVRMEGVIDFMAVAPVGSRHLSLAFAAPAGLFVSDELGTMPRRVGGLPGLWLAHCEWSPVAPRLLLSYRRPAPLPDGTKVSGVVLVHLDRVGGPANRPWLERLHEHGDVHTLWWSPGGKWATWATRSGVGYCPPGGQVVEVCPAGSEPAGITGARWDASERWLAITAGARLFVHDASDGSTRLVCDLGQGEPAFLADPVWIGDRVYLSRYVDLAPNPRGVPGSTLLELRRLDDRPR